MNPDFTSTGDVSTHSPLQVEAPKNRPWHRRAGHALAFVIVAAVYFYRLDTPVLWNDEADTGVFARNVLQCGVPSAFDGRNVSTDGDCLNLSRDHLVQKLHPWLQYYVAAASLWCFGHDTFGARALCTLLGAASFFPLAATLRRCTRTAVPIAMLLLLDPQVVLFQRQCRYFPLLILLSTTMLLLASGAGPRHRCWLYLSAIAVSVAMFHTHPLAAMCSCVSVIGVLACTDRQRLPPFLVALPVGFLSWAAWFYSLGPAANSAAAALPPVVSHPVPWLIHTAESLWISIADLDYVNAVPMLAWGLIAAAAFLGNDRGFTAVLTSRVPLLIAANLVLQLIVTAAATGYEGELKFSLLRYMPHLVLLAPVPLFMLVEAVTPPRFALTAIVMLASCNILTLSYWWPHLPLRRAELSWWPPVYAEIIAPAPDGYAAAIAFIKEQGAGDSADSVIRVVPQFLNDVFIFYLGDRYLIQPWNDLAAFSPAVLRSSLPSEAIDKVFAQPTWHVLALTRPPRIPPGWSAVALPSDRDAADGARPELTRHRFFRVIPGAIVLLRRNVGGN